MTRSAMDFYIMQLESHQHCQCHSDGEEHDPGHLGGDLTIHWLNRRLEKPHLRDPDRRGVQKAHLGGRGPFPTPLC